MQVVADGMHDGEIGPHVAASSGHVCVCTYVRTRINPYSWGEGVGVEFQAAMRGPGCEDMYICTWIFVTGVLFLWLTHPKVSNASYHYY